MAKIRDFAITTEAIKNYEDKLNPIIIVGSPRSGTSVVARILQERCGIMMDEGPINKDQKNPSGYYEDHRLIEINAPIIELGQRGQIDLNKMPLEWASKFGAWVAYRQQKFGDKWGFKDPRCIVLLGWITQFFNNPIFIWAFRSDKQVIKSQIEKLRFTTEVAERGVSAYHELIEKHTKNYILHKIDLSEQLSETTILKWLKERLNGRIP